MTFGIRGIELLHPCTQCACDQRNIARIGLDVRVAGRMHIPLRAIESAQHIQHAHRGCRLEVSRLAWLHLRIAGLLQEHRQPAHFKFGAGAHHQIRISRPRNQAGLGLNLVRILQGSRRNRYLDEITPELARECTPLGLTGEDPKGCIDLPAQARQHDSQPHCNPAKIVHVELRSRRVSVAMGAVRTQAHLVLQEELVVGESLP